MVKESEQCGQSDKQETGEERSFQKKEVLNEEGLVGLMGSASPSMLRAAGREHQEWTLVSLASLGAVDGVDGGLRHPAIPEGGRGPGEKGPLVTCGFRRELQLG
jgi:hypothetical protein